MLQTLRDRHRRFVALVVSGKPSPEAAREAGFAGKNAGAALLREPRIRDAIEKAHVRRANTWEGLQTKEVEQLALSPARVLNELALLAFCDPADYLSDDGSPKPISELTPVMRRALGTQPRDKVRALELLCRHYALLTDKLTVTTDEGLVRRLLEGRRRAARLTQGELSTSHKAHSVNNSDSGQVIDAVEVTDLSSVPEPGNPARDSPLSPVDQVKTGGEGQHGRQGDQAEPGIEAPLLASERPALG
ncbi:MAG: terminase small subunit [Candidatus Nanopelagicales bacterium]